ncbi:MAG: fatty acid desaturase [Acidimicrobiia bacterium]
MVRRTQVEWPTIAVAVAVYGSWLGLVFGHQLLPTPVLVLSLGLVAAWHGSLQHEAIHGHPTRSRRWNDALATPPLSLWLPYQTYRASHLRHHASALTVPGDDPETFYVHPEAWARAGVVLRAYWWLLRTLAGRLLVGSLTRPVEFWHAQLAHPETGRVPAAQVVRHVAAAACVLVVAVGIAGVPAVHYVLGCYLGTALTLLRSFVEHRAVDDQARSAVVRSGRLFGLLYLNNNLHYTHHAVPGAPWYRLRSLTTSLDAEALAAGGAGTYRGYAEVVRRYAFRPFSQPLHPSAVEVR